MLNLVNVACGCTAVDHTASILRSPRHVSPSPLPSNVHLGIAPKHSYIIIIVTEYKVEISVQDYYIEISVLTLLKHPSNRSSNPSDKSNPLACTRRRDTQRYFEFWPTELGLQRPIGMFPNPTIPHEHYLQLCARLQLHPVIGEVFMIRRV